MQDASEHQVVVYLEQRMVVECLEHGKRLYWSIRGEIAYGHCRVKGCNSCFKLPASRVHGTRESVPLSVIDVNISDDKPEV